MTQRELVDQEVANVFGVIFSRMNMSTINYILEARKKTEATSLNGDLCAQVVSQKEYDIVIECAVRSIIDHDMSTIIKVLKESGLFTKVLDDNN